MSGQTDLREQGEWAAPIAPDTTGTDAGESIVTMLWEQLQKTPHKTALHDATSRWTYQELHEAADRIARRLQDEGVGPGDRVGICMPRTNNAIAAIVGVLVAGAAYVPLDPGYPADRLTFMCEQADARLVLGPPELTDRLDTAVVRLDPSGAAGAWELPDWRLPAPDPSSPAYVLFTSGSTGRPKGVQVLHRNVTALLRWAQTAFSASEFDASALDAPFSFDVSVFEIFVPLTMGGMVRILDNPLSIGELGPEDPVTFTNITPSALRELVRAGRVPSSLRTLQVGGEVLAPALAEQVLTQTSVTRLVNAYGPTETTVLTAIYEVCLPVDNPVPIGWELPGVHHFILDEHLDLVADGEIGELYIAGDQVADGYIGDPARTAECFVDWAPTPGAAVRVYRSGDLGRRRPDGALEFHGRADKQIKVRGYRVEPGEIETLMCQFPGVAEAFVRAEGEGPTAKLVGYIVPTAEMVVIDDLLASLRAALTPYMVPAGIVSLARFPLKLSGKLDEAALPPWTPSPERSLITTRPLSNDIEETVAGLMSELLGIERPLGPDDDFVDNLGGTSLGVVRLLALMEETFGGHLPVDRVASDTTVAGFADLVLQRASGKSGPMVVHGTGSKPPLFLFHAYLGALLKYRRLGPYLSPERPLVAMNAHDLGGHSDSPTTIEEMAERVMAEVHEIQPAGPYLLGGHSAGGFIAYEIARRLVDNGEEVAELVILDSPVSSPRWRYYWSEVALNWPEVRHATAAERVERVRRIVRSRLSLHRQAPVQDRVAAAMERSNRLSNLACLHYVTPHYPGDIVILRTQQGVQMAAGDRQLGWGRHVGGTITCLDIDGGHTSMFEPEFVSSVADRINEVLGDTGPPAHD